MIILDEHRIECFNYIAKHDMEEHAKMLVELQKLETEKMGIM